MNEEITSEQILQDAKNKHGLEFRDEDEMKLLALVNYSRLIGYNDGFQDGDNFAQRVDKMRHLGT